MKTRKPITKNVWVQGKYTGVTVYHAYEIENDDRRGYCYHAREAHCYGTFEEAKKHFPDLRWKDKVPFKRACLLI